MSSRNIGDSKSCKFKFLCSVGEQRSFWEFGVALLDMIEINLPIPVRPLCFVDKRNLMTKQRRSIWG